MECFLQNIVQFYGKNPKDLILRIKQRTMKKNIYFKIPMRFFESKLDHMENRYQNVYKTDLKCINHFPLSIRI